MSYPTMFERPCGEHGPRGERRRDERGHGPRGPRGGGFGPGFGPGMMGAFGPGFFGPRGRGPGRGKRGDVRNAILALLAEEPLNGYQVIAQIGEKSQGVWRPSPGSVYPALNLLTDEGLIHEVDLDGKKAHDLTDAGRAYVAEHAEELEAPWDRVAGPHQGFVDVRQEIGQLAMAVTQVAQAGTPDQIEAARAVLKNARKELYKILAED